MAFFGLFGSKDPNALPKRVNGTRAVELVKEGATLIDVRETHEWKMGHARSAVHIPLGALSERTSRIPKGKPVVVVCATGSRSNQGAAALRAAGFEATSLSGGMYAWQTAGGTMS